MLRPDPIFGRHCHETELTEAFAVRGKLVRSPRFPPATKEEDNGRPAILRLPVRGAVNPHEKLGRLRSVGHLKVGRIFPRRNGIAENQNEQCRDEAGRKVSHFAILAPQAPLWQAG